MTCRAGLPRPGSLRLDMEGSEILVSQHSFARLERQLHPAQSWNVTGIPRPYHLNRSDYASMLVSALFTTVRLPVIGTQ